MAIVGLDTVRRSERQCRARFAYPRRPGRLVRRSRQFTVLFATDKVQHNRNALDRARKGDNIGDDDHDESQRCLSVGRRVAIAGVCARMSTDGYTNQYEALAIFVDYAQDVKLFKNISGTRSTLADESLSPSPPTSKCTLKLEIRAGTQKVYIDGVLMLIRPSPIPRWRAASMPASVMNGNNSGNAAISSFQSESVVDGYDAGGVLSGAGDLTAALTTDITMAAALSGRRDDLDGLICRRAAWPVRTRRSRV